MEASLIAEKIRATLSQPYLLTVKHEAKPDTTVEHRCAASIGVALFVDPETSQDEILKWADTAMYQAKEAGRDAIRFFHPGDRTTGLSAQSAGGYATSTIMAPGRMPRHESTLLSPIKGGVN